MTLARELKLASDIVGREAPATEERIDARWLMAYSAGLGETEFPHPLFPVCYEWPATHELRACAGLEPLNARLVHAQHDLTIHRQPRAGETLSIAAKVAAAVQRKPGAYVVFRIVARDASGAPVSSTDFGVLYRGVPLEGGNRSLEPLADPAAPAQPLAPVGEIAVAATAAHVYTECARIWNPIHTDVAYARAAGLPGIILHGTATLAYSVSCILRKFKIDPVRRVRCRFTGMVLMPSRLQVFASAEDKHVAFEIRNDRGETVIERGRIG